MRPGVGVRVGVGPGVDPAGNEEPLPPPKLYICLCFCLQERQMERREGLLIKLVYEGYWIRHTIPRA
jgi:hypothetical protein